MVEENYSIKVRDGETVLEITGNKRFVTRSFEMLKGILNKEFKTGLRQRKVTKTDASRERGGKREKAIKPKEPVDEKTEEVNPESINTDLPQDLSTLTISELFKKMSPKRDNHRILLMAFYMNKVQNRRGFKGKDLDQLYAELGLKAPKNISNFLRRMAENKAHWIAHGKKHGHYKITDKGVEFVKTGIPRN
jgi:hypothetical protein